MAGDAQNGARRFGSHCRAGGARTRQLREGQSFWHAQKTDIPLARRLAGRVLSLATRLATGLAVDDCQCGYTAISRSAALGLPLDDLWPRFGYPTDLLGMLAARGLTVVEVPVRPVYADERSGVRAWHALSILLLIARRYAARTPGAPCARLRRGSPDRRSAQRSGVSAKGRSTHRAPPRIGGLRRRCPRRAAREWPSPWSSSHRVALDEHVSLLATEACRSNAAKHGLAEEQRTAQAVEVSASCSRRKRLGLLPDRYSARAHEPGRPWSRPARACARPASARCLVRARAQRFSASAHSGAAHRGQNASSR